MTDRHFNSDWLPTTITTNVSDSIAHAYTTTGGRVARAHHRSGVSTSSHSSRGAPRIRCAPACVAE